MSSADKMRVRSCDDPLKCEKLGVYKDMIKDTTIDGDLGMCLQRYRTDGCRVTCGVRGDCERAFTKNLMLELLNKIPAARFLTDTADDILNPR